MTTTFEEALECPHCHNRMDHELFDSDPAKKTKVYATVCMTEGCRWFGTGRVIQTVNGEVFERRRGERGMDKSFPEMSPSQLAQGQRMVEDVKGKDLRG